MPKEQVSYHALSMACVTLAYLVSYALVEVVFLKTAAEAGGLYVFASLLFLPHGVRIVTTLIFGPLVGFIYLFISSMLIVLIPNIGNDLPFSSQVLQAFVGAGCAPIAFKILDYSVGTAEIYFKKITLKSWRLLLLAILISSFINSIGQTAVLDYTKSATINMSLLISYLTGDLLGAIVVIFGSYYTLRRLKL